jgi:hypothetical protein
LFAVKLLEKPTSEQSKNERAARCKKYFAQFCIITQEYPHDQRLGDAVASSVMAVSKITQIENAPELNAFYKILEQQIRDSDTQTKIQATSTLNILFNELNEQQASVFVKNGTLDSLFDNMDLYQSNPEDLAHRIECINKISGILLSF